MWIKWEKPVDVYHNRPRVKLKETCQKKEGWNNW